MLKSLRPHRVARIALPLLLLAVSACEQRVTAVQTFPPSVDVQALTEVKPKPTPDIVTNPQAAERYNAAVESWGDRVHNAGVRVCDFLQTMGAKYPFKCKP